MSFLLKFSFEIKKITTRNIQAYDDVRIKTQTTERILKKKTFVYVIIFPGQFEEIRLLQYYPNDSLVVDADKINFINDSFESLPDHLG